MRTQDIGDLGLSLVVVLTSIRHSRGKAAPSHMYASASDIYRSVIGIPLSYNKAPLYMYCSYKGLSRWDDKAGKLPTSVRARALNLFVTSMSG